MGSKKKDITKLDQAVVDATMERVAEKAGAEGVPMEIAAMRMDAEHEAKVAYERREARGEIAPTEENMPFEDDMRTERDILAEKEAKLIADLVTILKVPKTKDSLMTFSMYSTTNLNRRYFLLDVDGTAYRKGWALYKEVKGDDPVGYIDMVMHIMDLEIPRLHRAVDWAPLN